MHWLYFVLLLAGSYLVGAIPSGLIVGLLVGKSPLNVGSGKTGASNTLRAAGPAAAVTVLVLDLLKGAIVVLAARAIPWPDEAWLGLAMGCAAAAAVVGHNWSIWVRLYAGKWGGGRGIMTALGAMLVISPLVVLVAGVAGGIALLLTRYIVVGTLVGALGGLIALFALSVAGQLSLGL